MRYTNFEIHNFRGIINAQLPLSGKPASKVHTLVGLNESGKTTVLEAINHLSYKSESLDALELEGYSITDQHSLIPISKRANFNETVDIIATIELDEKDERDISSELKKQHGIRLEQPIGIFKITRRMIFADSRFVPEKSSNFWSIKIIGKTTGQRKARQLTNEPCWPNITKTIIPYIPSILFFPNFLFEFPERIYLNSDTTDETSAFYRVLLQDILDTLGNKTDVNTHILERAKSGSANDKRNLDGLLLDMSRHVTQTIFSAWDEMFHQKMTKKRVVITCEEDDKSAHYINFRLEDNDGFYQIRERSLGFRWFFVFLLLTHYRARRQRGPSDVLFLFDEPASNLHPTAQSQLLRSFESLSKGCHIIYTTHSHHMVNPKWLESTYVVKNEGLDYTNDAVEYSATKTNITVTKYREFASKHPDQTSYFRPILDVLEYSPSSLENVPNVIMIEGKTDYYLIALLIRAVFPKKRIYLLPGSGASSLDTLIRLYSAWARSFLVLLDSDGAGVMQKDRYAELFGHLITSRIFLLSEILGDNNISAGESLLTNDERMAILQIAYPEDKSYAKKRFHRAVQESLMADIVPALSEPTIARVKLLIESLENRLSEQDGRTCASSTDRRRSY